MPSSLADLQNLEKKYMKKLWNIFSSNAFKRNLRIVERYININYKLLAKNYDEKNKIKVGAERLIRFHIYKNLNVKNVYPSPISSDMAVELEDAVLNIDAKTIDMSGNPGDDLYIHFQRNQITFNNIALYKHKIGSYHFGGVRFPPRLIEFHNNKPCLTFFTTVNYYDDSSSFRLSYLSLCSVPHKLIAEKEFNNRLISNYKTYDYIGKKRALSLGKDFAPRRPKKRSWIPFSLKNDGNNDVYLDLGLNHPIRSNSKCVWKLIDKKYEILVYGGSARIDKNTLLNRKDSKNRDWKGFIKKDI